MVLGPNLDRQNLDRTKPRQDKTSTKTKPRHGQNLDIDKTSTDKTSTRQNLDKTKSRHGQITIKNFDKKNLNKTTF